jgi:peroxiredoxin Q/BCP
MSALAVGTSAPDFTLPKDGGGSVSLLGLRGKKVVIYFYPKADTPGCTIESKDFSSMRSAFEKVDTEIVGVSADPVKAQDKFKAKHDLTVTLASDETRTMLERYGVWVEKSMYGKKYMGIERTTVLVDREGNVARIWPKVKIEGHTAEVLEAAEALA